MNFNAHLPNALAILKALEESNRRMAGQPDLGPLASLSCLADWQRLLLEEFPEQVAQPSYDFISRSSDSWLIVGDRRRAVADEVRLVIHELGLGPGLLLLHLQQLRAGHIPLRFIYEGSTLDLAKPTESLTGARREHVLSIPVRSIRADATALAELGISKPPALYDRSRIRSHERDGAACFFCSCAEINPAEVVIPLSSASFGLDRDLCLGAAFAPFGHPAKVVHFLAWHRAAQPLGMGLSPGGIADLLRLTAAINDSIRSFFSARGITEVPVFDGLFNGWAGNSIFHHHLQFLTPEFAPPLAAANHVARENLARRDDVSISRFDWPLPVYEVRSDNPLRTAFVAHELAALWRFLGGDARVPYRHFAPTLPPSESDLVPAHTQNLYAPGASGGRVLWFILRDRRKIDFVPQPGDMINAATGQRALAKRNIGTLEATGTWIVDADSDFAAMRYWSKADISEQIRRMLSAASPDSAAVCAFEKRLGEVIPR